MQQAHRRRRKRGRAQLDGKQQSQTTRRCVPSFDDDSSLAFLDDYGEVLRGKDTKKAVLPAILEERRSGLKNARSIVRWQAKALSKFTSKPEEERHCRRQWRPFARRCIPFTKLGTPISDAVLALERNGSFVLSLGGTTEGSAIPLSLAIRFYGIPSRWGIHANERTVGRRPGVTPLLATIPLLYDPMVNESAEETIFNFTRNVSPATTPVKILVSNDWNMGMAMFQPSNVWREEGQVGTIVLFGLPQGHRRSRVTKAMQCVNVRMGATASFTLRNLLWRVDKTPTRDRNRPGKQDIFDSILQLPGYLLFNDEEDGFRITWVLDEWDIQISKCHEEASTSPLQSGFISSTPILSVQDTWEDFHYDSHSGKRVLLEDEASASGVSVANEVFLHVDVLLGEILNRRKGVSESYPEYFYNLVTVTDGGRVAQIVITFLRKEKPGSLGMFVNVDLFTGKAQELDWVKSTGTLDTSALRMWTNTLALNRRMRHVAAGPFSINAKGHSRDWGRLCKELNFDYDEEDDYDPSFWSEFIGNTQTKRPPKLISLASIYPDCDLVTNDAITSCLPVSSLQCKNAPVQLFSPFCFQMEYIVWPISAPSAASKKPLTSSAT
eukprot:scaffold1470_cov195-Cylindrotheca_fusiformis.AAC.3